MSTWRFEKRDRWGVLTVPKDEEHFSAVTGIVTSLVRETTQNSGDAASGSNPVRMTFKFGKIDAQRFKDFVSDLPAHLVDFSEQRDLLTGSKMVPYLAIEDFGTTGLTGDYGEDADIDSSYIAFWRRYGDSNKEKESGGRHGLGKSTIARASKLRLFFGATVRSDDPSRTVLLQGQISLRPHAIDQDTYDAYGMWWDKDSRGNLSPFIGKAAASFMHAFDLSRGQEPGLSVVIPFYDEDFKEADIVKEVIENTFHQIVTGQLIVEVEDTVINSSTIARLAEAAGLQNLKSAIALSAEINRKTIPTVSPRPDTVTRLLAADHFSDATLQQMRQWWLAGEIIAVELPVRIQKKDEQRPQLGSVRLYAKRERHSDQTKETYVRGRVTVPLRPMANRANCISLLVADKGVASTFLGDAEPPAHNRWRINRVRSLYVRADQPLRRILTGLRNLLDILEGGEEDQAIKDAFIDYLWVIPPDDDESDPAPEPRPEPQPAPPPPPSPPPAAGTPHRLRPIDGGFAYSYQPEEPEGADGARIFVSYRRRTGSKKVPKSLKFRDFTAYLPVEEEGAAELEQVSEPRRVVFNLANISPGYELRVTGFDTNRDLELRLETVTA